jgi:hypothetical protein
LFSKHFHRDQVSAAGSGSTMLESSVGHNSVVRPPPKQVR